MEPQECETEADADADAAEGRARGMGRRTDGSLAAKGEPYLRRGIPAHQASGGSANTKKDGSMIDGRGDTYVPRNNRQKLFM